MTNNLVCDMTNYSLGLRNCEHVTDYIHNIRSLSVLPDHQKRALKDLFVEAIKKNAQHVNVLLDEVKDELPKNYRYRTLCTALDNTIIMTPD